MRRWLLAVAAFAAVNAAYGSEIRNTEQKAVGRQVSWNDSVETTLIIAAEQVLSTARAALHMHDAGVGYQRKAFADIVRRKLYYKITTMLVRGGSVCESDRSDWTLKGYGTFSRVSTGLGAMAVERKGNIYVGLPLEKVTDSGGMTMSEFTNADASIKVEEGKKDTDSNCSKSEFSRYLEIFAAELVGTGILLFVGCASCIQGDDNKPITDFHSALTFGFTVSTIICIFGHISAAHLNPAVTVAFYVLGHINVPLMVVYLVAQVMGAVMGVGVLVLLTPDGWIKSDMCVTQPHDMLTGYQAAAIEFIATMALIFLVCGLSDPRCAARQDSVPLKFAALLIALSLAVGKYTGASLNPVRSLGPAVWTGNWNQHWVYWISPLSAGVVTPLFYTTCFLRGVQS